jgi:hypothetical protein
MCPAGYFCLLKVRFIVTGRVGSIARSHVISGYRKSYLWHIVLRVAFWYAHINSSTRDV